MNYSIKSYNCFFCHLLGRNFRSLIHFSLIVLFGYVFQGFILEGRVYFFK